MAVTQIFILLQYIDDTLPPESPYLYGLHPNAEIGFLTQTSEKLFRTVLEMQPRDGGAGEGGGTTRSEKVKRKTTARSWGRLINFCFEFEHYYT